MLNRQYLKKWKILLYARKALESQYNSRNANKVKIDEMKK